MLSSMFETQEENDVSWAQILQLWTCQHHFGEVGSSRGGDQFADFYGAFGTRSDLRAWGHVKTQVLLVCRLGRMMYVQMKVAVCPVRMLGWLRGSIHMSPCRAMPTGTRTFQSSICTFSAGTQQVRSLEIESLSIWSHTHLISCLQEWEVFLSPRQGRLDPPQKRWVVSPLKPKHPTSNIWETLK